MSSSCHEFVIGLVQINVDAMLTEGDGQVQLLVADGDALPYFMVLTWGKSHGVAIDRLHKRIKSFMTEAVGSSQGVVLIPPCGYPLLGPVMPSFCAYPAHLNLY